MNNDTNKPGWGIFSPDGYFQPLGLLDSKSLEYAGKTIAELETLMQENIAKEQYEVCAIIRDELARRAA